MIVDSSALIAILRHEPDAADLAALLDSAAAPKISAATVLEASLVAGPDGHRFIDVMLSDAQIEIVAFGHEHMMAAREAHARYGRGSGSKARLNFGDCISYALAKVTGEPLLFKGDDFRHTDVTPAR